VVDLVPDDPVRVLQPRVERGASTRSRGFASSVTASRTTPSTRTSISTSGSTRPVAWHNPDPEYMQAPIDGAVNVTDRAYFVHPAFGGQIELAISGMA